VIADAEPHGDNQNSARHETRRTLRNKRREYLKGKINKLETSHKRKVSDTYIGINEFKKC
jgi:hypothetical protein